MRDNARYEAFLSTLKPGEPEPTTNAEYAEFLDKVKAYAIDKATGSVWLNSFGGREIVNHEQFTKDCKNFAKTLIEKDFMYSVDKEQAKKKLKFVIDTFCVCDLDTIRQRILKSLERAIVMQRTEYRQRLETDLILINEMIKEENENKSLGSN